MVPTPRRTSLDWVLEAVALAGLIAVIAIIATYWPQIPPPRRFRFRPPPQQLALVTGNVKTALLIMSGLAAATYAALTAAAHSRRLIRLPEEVDTDSPHVRQLLLSMMIVTKAVIMLLFVYFAWTMLQVVLGRARGMNPASLSLFVLLVPLPLIFYTVKLRRYRK
jgi:hypothetical protein